MKKTTLLIRSLLVLLAVAVIVVLSPEISSPNAPTPSVAAKPVTEPNPTPSLTLGPATPQGSGLFNPSLTNPGYAVAPIDPAFRQPSLSVLSGENVNSAETRLSPGIYTASPNTGIVVIPAPLDEAFVKPVPPGPNMPTVEPHIQLTPRSR